MRKEEQEYCRDCQKKKYAFEAGKSIWVKTRPQKVLGSRDRIRNLKGAFGVTKSWIPKKCVLVIDDIYTTGNTIHRVAKVLKNAGAQKVYFLTISIGQGL